MRTLAFILGFMLLTGCNRGPAKTEPTDKTEAPDPAQFMPKIPNQLANLGEKMAAIDNEAKAMKPVDPVHFSKLLPLLPKAPAGYKAEEPTGSTNKIGEYSHTVVERLYHNDDNQTLRVTITDIALIPELYRGFAVAALVSNESTDGFDKGVTIDGDPGVERWKKEQKRSELTIMLGKRFIVEVRAEDVTQDFARKVYATIDRKALMALK